MKNIPVASEIALVVVMAANFKKCAKNNMVEGNFCKILNNNISGSIENNAIHYFQPPRINDWQKEYFYT